ncbi:Structural maintenance of chromosomes flexible hinge domain-containing 1 [Chlorella sorokiniana]|uniref:Structural maintenance of chromosomes flexible hinge domain-containing 1 n=1 Tax=Chlorella sorokiniana TaxID=3076 RepID=A0A2P6TW64_CHLSO|nr:Structural maintenance of chromosomes flexible hinge domain-containing 1 [Chlorella sorokiniana]|eukprot:PRW58303.1 Structural maintenance of chromosomes flexible hinge domain-containing 1 [Chlorella sorokiniana]
MGSVRLVLPGSGAGDCRTPLPATLASLRAAAERHFGAELRGKDYVLTDTAKVFDSDADAAGLRDGATLVLAWAADRALAAPAREKISFQPHPKTLTMAGEFEYFAAQGRHPFVYALAEFVDNSLRATRRNGSRPRCITISLVVSGSNPATARGLVAIQDNGCGMSKQELADWAVMNLSMEERGAQPQEPAAGRGNGAAAAGAGRFLTGDLSFFGVGSKNAGFFMGSSIKVATKRADELYVHELCLAAADLEARYQAREEVYVEDMVHRNPGDPSTLTAMEQPFSMARAWVAAEGEPDGGALGDALGGDGTAGTGPSFTRVVIGDLKPDVLRQIMDGEQGGHVCQELAHLYHYYLHGEQGNRDGGGKKERLPNGEPFPEILLRYQVDSRTVWQRRLAEVDDDMETRLLRAQQAELPFTLQVPDKGTVSGVLYYFPFQNDAETVPVENPLTSAKPVTSPFRPGGATQRPVGTQLPRATQAPPRATQLGGGGGGGLAAMEEDEEDEGPDAWQTAPIFEAFWQGRLIPGARIDTLPFVEAVRQKRTAQAKDVIPDEAFRRLRGALFFGPAFRVTRNKLLFRDNLAEVLAGAVPGERQMEAKFKQWLQRCHSTLDKSVRFEALADARTQAAVRSKHGEATTAFERITDGSRTAAVGDVVRINAKPQLVGRVLFFTIPQATKEEGAYANGRVHVELLPAEVYGAGCEKQFSLRRLEAVLSEVEQQEHLQREMLKVLSSLRIEPMRFTTGQTLEFSAGATIPETTASVLNGAGQRMVKTAFTNERLMVTQRLWRLPPEGQGGAAAPGGEQQEGEEEAGGRAAKRQRKGRKGRARQDENADPAAGQAAGGDGAAAAAEAGLPPGSELLLSVENKTPNKETFQFARISDGLHKSGRYALEFVAAPASGGQPPLRAVVQLAVAPGSPCSFAVSGEGTAVAAVKELALGEVLPPLKVMFSDKYGNPVAMNPSATPPSLTIAAALPGGPDGELQSCGELQVVAAQAATEDGLIVSGLQLLGSEAAATAAAQAAAEGAEPTGLQLLSAGDGLSHPTARQAQAPLSKQGLPVAEVQLRISLASSPELEPVVLPLRLRAGAPHSLRLLPGNPWEEAAASPSAGGVVMLQHSAALAPFQAAAFDAWGNPTAPAPDLGFAVLAECEATAPRTKELAVGPTGLASIEGLAGGTSTRATGPATLRLSLKPYPTNQHTEAAVAAADPTHAIELPLAVEPSTLPVALQLLRDGTPLPTRVVEGEDGPSQVAVLEGLPAGSSAGGLKVALLDESGQPAACEVAGKVTLSWRSGSKKVTWGSQASTATPGIKLPPAKMPESVAEVSNHWVRFTSADPPLVLEAAVQMQAVPADPAIWTLSLVDQLTSQHAEELGTVQCGQLFVLEVEALDAFNNRCSGGGAALPQPQLALESEGPLQYNEAEWEQGWVSQGGEQVYSVCLAVAGHPGPLKITVRDSGGEGGTSLLTEDALTVELRAGPPAQLSVEGPGTLEVGTKAALPQLRVRVCDAAGNPTTSETFEVSLNSSALATDGSGRAASVSVAGGNKVKVKKGAAVFKDVRVSADEAGSYALRVQSASRKVAVADGVLHLLMQPLNAVTDLRVLLPETLEGGECQAGTGAEVHVAVLTENGMSLPPGVAAGALTLKVTPPGGGRSDVVAYSLAAPSEEAGEEPLQSEDGHFAFQLQELRAAGTYSAVAEYVEQRPELAAGLSKKDATLRSASVQFQVQPCQPVTLRLEAAQLPDKLAVTNGANAKQRLLLRNAAVQLEDEFGNAAPGGGVQVRFRLRYQGEGVGSSGSQLPALQAAQGRGQQETDERGRAFLGDLAIAEGSGRAAAGALECELVCEALGLYPSSSHELETDGEGWAVCWACPVLFSDDAARFAHIERLNQQRGELVTRRDELQQRLAGAQQALEGVQKEQSKMEKVLASKQKALAGPAPESVKSAQRELAKAQKAAAAQAAAEPEEALEARYGKGNAAASVDRALQSGDAGLVGVFAQLATVDDRQLGAVLAASQRGSLAVVVVADAAARQRVAAALARDKYPAPDMLPMTNMLPYTGKTGDSPGFAGASEQAHALQRAACRGADAPLAMPLPHTARMTQLRDKANGLGMSANDWPRGCLGFAVNLARPVHKGHRASVLYSMLGQALVFETLRDAEEYKEFLSQKLRHGSSTFLSLDGGRITSNGIVSGASFQVPPVERADYRFGSSGLLGENPVAAQAAEQAAALEEWVELLRSRDQLEASAVAAQADADAAEAECRGQLDEVEGRIAELEAQLALGDMKAAEGRGGRGGGGSAGGSARKRRSRRQQQSEEPAEQEVVVLEDDEQQQQQQQQQQQPPAGDGGKKRRRMQRMQG